MARCDGCTTWRHFQTQASPNPSALLLSTPGRRGSRNVRSINASSAPNPPPHPPFDCLNVFGSTVGRAQSAGVGVPAGWGGAGGTAHLCHLRSPAPCRFSRIRCVISQACDRPPLVQGQLLKPEGGGGETPQHGQGSRKALGEQRGWPMTSYQISRNSTKTQDLLCQSLLVLDCCFEHSMCSIMDDQRICIYAVIHTRNTNRHLLQTLDDRCILWRRVSSQWVPFMFLWRAGDLVVRCFTVTAWRVDGPDTVCDSASS